MTKKKPEPDKGMTRAEACALADRLGSHLEDHRDGSIQEFIVPDALVRNYAPSVQDFQLRHTSRRGRSPARCERTGTAGILSRG
jgi:hypothetical protein